MDETQPRSTPLSLWPEFAKRLCLIVPLTAMALAWDLYSKSAVFGRLGYPHRHGEVYFWLGRISTFQLFTSFNEGALWGFGQGLTWLFAALSIVAVVAIVYCLLFTATGRTNWVTVALCLILAGTLGNLYDRLGLHGCKNPETGERFQAVRDFLLFTIGTYSWPIFNFADVFLVTGTGMLVAFSFWIERRPPPQSAVSTNPAIQQSANL